MFFLFITLRFDNFDIQTVHQHQVESKLPRDGAITCQKAAKLQIWGLVLTFCVKFQI